AQRHWPRHGRSPKPRPTRYTNSCATFLPAGRCSRRSSLNAVQKKGSACRSCDGPEKRSARSLSNGAAVTLSRRGWGGCPDKCRTILNEKTNPPAKVTPEGDGFARSVTFVIFARDSFSIFIIFQ